MGEPREGSNLPPEVTALVATSLASFAHVEILVLLARNEGAEFSVTHVARELQIPADKADRVLAQLAASGVIKSSPAAYRYAPDSAVLKKSVEALHRMYETKPVTLINAVYARPPAAIQSFSDSFRVRGNEEGNDG